MSKIERFYVSGCENHDCDPLEIDRDGDYVYYDEYEKLKAENESLRADAERYQRLKLDASMGGSLIERLDCNVPVKLWDSAIDRELAK